MTICNVSSTQSPYQTDVQSAWKQRAQDFKALKTALQSGDLAAAQTAFAAWQKDQPNSTQAATTDGTTATTATTASNGTSSPATQGAKDLQTLQTALISGDLSGAQQAFAALQQDLQAAGRVAHHRHHHHHHGDSTSSTTPASDSTASADASSTSTQKTQTAKDFEALKTALTSGDLSGAQQAFAALQQDLQSAGRAGHHHYHHHGDSTSSTTPATDTSSTAAATQPIGSTLDVQA